MKNDYLYTFLLKYPLFPSVALWRGGEARLFAKLDLEEPILDLGCGNGYFAKVALNKRIHTGCDKDFPQARRARSSGAYQHTMVGDVCDLPFKDRSFDTIICNCVLEHVQDVGRTLQEVFRVLAPGGMFVFTVPTEKFNEWFYLSWLLRKMRLSRLAKNQIERYNRFQFHYHICSVHEWSVRLREAGFHVEHYQYYAPQAFQILASALDDIQHIVGRLIVRKESSSERCTTQMSGWAANHPFARIAARFWWYLTCPFYRIESSGSSGGAAVLVQARKSIS
ncbi:MAG: class I SAM-dependent methyltransferase [Candidatus Hydrogenedentota bacterium]|nr:MAG: class I SAM-dependent methyltransferase [Candidatus Hydrogenedentota bacterium]